MMMNFVEEIITAECMLVDWRCRYSRSFDSWKVITADCYSYIFCHYSRVVKLSERKINLIIMKISSIMMVMLLFLNIKLDVAVVSRYRNMTMLICLHFMTSAVDFTPCSGETFYQANSFIRPNIDQQASV